MTTIKKDGLQGLRSLRHELLERLRTNPDFLALREVEKAIKTIEDAIGKPKKPRSRGKSKTKISQLDAAEKALRNNGAPMPIGALVDSVKAMGATIGGKDPRTNLASVMSKDKDRFRSVPWGETRGWWLVGNDYPNEPDLPDGAVAILPKEVDALDEIIEEDSETDAEEVASNDSSSASAYIQFAGGQDG